VKTALISDIHGNLEALTAVLRDIEIQRVDNIHCLGDVIGYGADPGACLKLVSSNCDVILMGNHEYTALGLQSTSHYNEAARQAIEWTQTMLSETDFATMADFELDRLLDGFYIVHASPFEPERWHYVFSETEAALAIKHLKSRLGFHGHSHVPVINSRTGDGPIRTRAAHTLNPAEDTHYLINVGSVGQPRDHDPRACYVIYDDDEQEIVYQRVEYDIETTQKKMTAVTLPEILVSRLAAGV